MNIEPIKQISLPEAENYIEISIYDPFVCTKARYYTLQPSTDMPPGWEDVRYYGDSESIDMTPLHPLEVMYKEWNQEQSIYNHEES